MQKNALIIFAKYPEPGKVKTRLAKRIGIAQAANLYRVMAEQVVFNTTSHFFDQSIYFDPPEKKIAMQNWLGSKQYREQSSGDLGERLYAALAQESLYYDKTAVIGTDCIDVEQNLILETFRLLDQFDFVLGPAQDGGYYLFAGKIWNPLLFTGISWSTDRVFQQTLERIEQLGKTYTLLKELTDLDE